jgi:EF-P beta-lysylation protein EpmB
MITRSVAIWQTDSWQQEMANLVNNVAELCELLQLDPATLGLLTDADTNFPLRVPRGFVNRMEKGNPSDPLLLQVLPVAAELLPAYGYSHDPLRECEAIPAKGLIHKYHGRALLIVNGACGIHCRYCFRRHFPYAENNPGKADWQQALDYVRNDETISELILSGGDPLVANDKHLGWLVEQIADIAHVKRLRLHTRMPIIIPGRITPSCLEWLTASRLQTIMVVHCNHANEIDENVSQCLQQVRQAGITLLNQTVLLKGINDNCDALIALSERLFESGTLPYYLHLLDHVNGAAHFDLAEYRAQKLYAELTSRLPGYLVPRLVKELPYASSKTLLIPAAAGQ